MTKTIGVIGLGSIGMRHAKNLIAMGHTVWSWDQDDHKLSEFGFHGGQKAHSVNDLMSLGLRLHRPIEAVVIASPTEKHAEHIHEAELIGKPYFVEKPIKHLLTDREGINAVMVGYNLRFHSCVKKAREWLNEGRIGTPLWANFTLGQFSEKEPYLRDGVILNWSHELDLALYLLGPAVLSGSSTRLTDGKDDISDILLTHNSGCGTLVHLDYVTKPEKRGFFISGNKGNLEIDLVKRRGTLYGTNNENKNYTEKVIGSDSYYMNYIEEMEAFLDRIDGKKTIGCTGEEGLEVLKICLEVRKQAGL